MLVKLTDPRTGDCTRDSDHVGHRLIVIDPAPARMTVLPFPNGSKANPTRGPKSFHSGHRPVNSVAFRLDELALCEVEDRETVVNLTRHAVVLPAQTEVQGDVRSSP